MRRLFIFLLVMACAIHSAFALYDDRKAQNHNALFANASFPAIYEMRSMSNSVLDVEEAGEGSATVTCKIEYDEQEITPLRIEALFAPENPGKRNRISYDCFHGMKEQVFKLAPGIYDFHVEFCKYDSQLPADNQMDFYNPHRHVILEGVEITDDVVLKLDAATATNYIQFKPLTPSGEEYRHPMLRGSSFDYTDANIIFETLALTISNSTYGEVQTSYTTSSHDTESGLSVAKRFDLYINDVSDKFSFAQTRFAVDPTNTLYILTLSTKGIPSAPVTNGRHESYLFEERFQFTPLYDKLQRDLYRSGMTVYANVNNLQTLKINYLSAYDYPKAWIGWSDNLSPDDKYSYQAWPFVYELDLEDAVSEDRTQLKIKGAPVDITPEGITYRHPTNQYFNWSRDKMKGIMGDNVPVNSLIMHAVTQPNGKKAVLYVPTCVGRYGETRESDLSTMEVEICYNGEPVCSSIADINTWAKKWAEDSHENGIMTARFTNTNIAIGDIQGRNELEITYNESNNDLCAPAVQVLSFSDENGVVTHHFTPDQNVMVEVAAGDPNGNGSRYTYMDASSVKVEYALHGTDNFIPVETKVVNNATSSSAWTVYGGEISKTSLSKNGWYDVRITVIDNENNKSVQKVSPAFNVSDLSGIDRIECESHKVKVICSDGVINIIGADSPEVNIYAAGGRKVLSAKGNLIDVRGLSSGVYIVVFNGKAYKIIL